MSDCPLSTSALPFIPHSRKDCQKICVTSDLCEIRRWHHHLWSHLWRWRDDLQRKNPETSRMVCREHSPQHLHDKWHDKVVHGFQEKENRSAAYLHKRGVCNEHVQLQGPEGCTWKQKMELKMELLIYIYTVLGNARLSSPWVAFTSVGHTFHE